MLITTNNFQELAWDKMDGLLPSIVQDQDSGQVLMQGYMNHAALEKTFETGLVTFFSRSKQRLWTKGETSNNTLEMSQVHVDCDKDSLLIMAKANGPTCHTGTRSCWEHAPQKFNQNEFLFELESLIASRKDAPADSSYTASLYKSGIKRIAQKVGEEGVETALAATVQDLDELKNESADLIYHLLVLLQASNLSMADVVDTLKSRHKK